MNVDQHRAEWARGQARKAVRAGILHVPDACEICGRTIAELQAQHDKDEERALQQIIQYPTCQLARRGFTPHVRTQPWLVGHHWRGYDHPLDVWWVCSPCNTALSGRHDGSLTLEQARAFVRSGQTGAGRKVALG